MTAATKLRILLVEDEKDFRDIFVLLGRHYDYEAVTAENGLKALELLSASAEVDVIALDLRMPVMDGFEFLERYAGPIPVVVMSAYEPEHCEPLAREVFGRVTKPLEMDAAVAMLRAAGASRK